MGAPTESANPRFDAPRVLMACAPVLGLAAFATLRWADWGASRDVHARGGAAELAVWQLLVTASVVVWTVLAGVGLQLLKDLNACDGEPRRGGRCAPSRGWRRETIVFVVFVYIAIGVVLGVGAIAGLRNPFVMDGQDWKIPVFHLVAGAANVPLLVVLKRVQLAAIDTSGWSTTARDVTRMRLLRRSLQSATACLGVVIALAVIATGALRKATAAAGLTPLPDTFVLVYGGWFTGVVAATYLFVFSALERRARWMLETAVPLPRPEPASAETFSARRNLRAELSQELELGGDPRKNLEGLLAVLAPLVGALLTRLGGL